MVSSAHGFEFGGSCLGLFRGVGAGARLRAVGLPERIFFAWRWG